MAQAIKLNSKVHCDLGLAIDLTSISLQKNNLKGHKSHALGCNLSVNLGGNTVECALWILDFRQ